MTLGSQSGLTATQTRVDFQPLLTGPDRLLELPRTRVAARRTTARSRINDHLPSGASSRSRSTLGGWREHRSVGAHRSPELGSADPTCTCHVLVHVLGLRSARQSPPRSLRGSHQRGLGSSGGGGPGCVEYEHVHLPTCTSAGFKPGDPWVSTSHRDCDWLTCRCRGCQIFCGDPGGIRLSAASAISTTSSVFGTPCAITIDARGSSPNNTTAVP